MFTDSQLRTALRGEYAFLCHDDFDPDNDMTDEQFTDYLSTLCRDELINLTGYDSESDIVDFIEAYS